jgi:hypothetical protein
LCVEFDSNFSDILPQCYTLNPYGTRVKYPDEIDVDEIKMCQATLAVKAIQSFPPIFLVHSRIKAEYSQQYTVNSVSAVTTELPKQKETGLDCSAPSKLVFQRPSTKGYEIII